MSYSKQFLTYILLQYLLICLLVLYAEPFVALPQLLRLVILVGAPVWQFCMLIASLGVLNTFNWDGRKLVVASVAVETVLVTIILTILNMWFGNNPPLPFTHIITTSFIAALANSALAYIIIIWLSDNYGDLMGYIKFGGWAFTQWLFAYLILSGIDSSILNPEDIVWLSFASIFVQMIMCLCLYVIIRLVLPKVTSKKTIYSLILLGACIVWGTLFAVLGQNYMFVSLGFLMSMFMVPMFSSSDGLPVVSV